jgi:anhydro-N-acetylmuramic acid kinase
MNQAEAKSTWTVIGLMSGSSLDGLDAAMCRFDRTENVWQYSLLGAETFAFPEALLSKLKQLPQATAIELASTDAAFARFSGEVVNKLSSHLGLKPEFVSSHGHTVFHQPSAGFTTQIGNGGLLAAACSLPVVCDFRTVDVGLGGQGAPLVPMGDKLLFSGFDGYLNLGGIANITIQATDFKAFDICACNQWFNFLAEEAGLAFDENGAMALSGLPQPKLVHSLFKTFENHKGSISNEYVRETLALFNQAECSLEDKMASAVAAVAILIRQAIEAHQLTKVLVTGGGAFNAALMLALQDHQNPKRYHIHLPDKATIQFKEAIIFGFLGLLRWLNETNIESSVTGSAQKHVAGAIYRPF